MSRTGWTDVENAAVVVDYFEMLADDLAGRPYSKANHNRSLQEKIQRGRGAIEFKHQNISAILLGLGETWLPGYKPAANFQSSLVEAVARHLAGRPEAVRLLGAPEFDPDASIAFGSPPEARNTITALETAKLDAVARQFDVAAIQARNRALGRAGEQQVVRHEQIRLNVAGREDLADQVRWVSDLDGDGAGYDIASFDISGAPRLLEVKTTNGWERTPFHISHNELEVSERSAETWRLVRLWNFVRSPRGFELRPPLTNHVSLCATSYRAEFTVRN